MDKVYIILYLTYYRLIAYVGVNIQKNTQNYD